MVLTSERTFWDRTVPSPFHIECETGQKNTYIFNGKQYDGFEMPLCDLIENFIRLDVARQSMFKTATESHEVCHGCRQ